MIKMFLNIEIRVMVKYSVEMKNVFRVKVGIGMVELLFVFKFWMLFIVLVMIDMIYIFYLKFWVFCCFF